MQSESSELPCNYAVVTDRLDPEFTDFNEEPKLLHSKNTEVYVIYSGLTYRQATLQKSSLNGLNFGNVWIERTD